MRLLVLSFWALSLFGQDYAGTYLGELATPNATPNATLRLGLILQKGADGKLSGEMVSIDQAYAKIRLADVELDGNKIKFRAAAVMASFEGEFSQAANTTVL